MIKNLQFIRELPNPDTIKALMPVPSEMKALKDQRDETVRNIFTGEDGTTAQIVVEENYVTIHNGNYDKCAAFHTILAIDRAKAQAQAEGFQLTEEQKNEIQAETEAIDFSAYDGQVLAYDLEQFDETTVNLVPLDEDQSPVWGLLLSYHADTGILGSLGNRAYLLQE